jgi:cation:H+ antiporter
MGISLLFIGLFTAIFALVKSADFFTDSARKIGLSLGLSDFIIGATIVAIGTSAPELVTSVLAVLQGATTFPVDNIIGSNIANCLLIGGICAIAAKALKVKKILLDVDLPFFFISTALFTIFIIDGEFTASEGIISLILLGVFVAYTLVRDKKEEKKVRPKLTAKTILIMILGAVGIYFSAKFTVQYVQEIAEILNIESAIVTMIVVGIGTSLPELVVSIRSVIAGSHSVALGNIFGSNVFNVLAVAGIPSLITSLKVSSTAVAIGIPFLIITTLSFIFVTSDDQIRSWEGLALLVVYITFLGKITGLL